MKELIRRWPIFLFLGLVTMMLQGFDSLNSEPVKIKYGLQLWSVKDDMKEDPIGTIEKLGAMGYQFVEAAGYDNGKFYDMDPAVFKKLCEDNGLKFLGSHTGKDVPNEKNWNEVMAWWDKAIEAHKTAGVSWIVQPSMDTVGYESLEGLKRYIAYFTEVGKKCKAKGIKFGYHNHEQEFLTEFNGKPVLDWMLDLTDPDVVMFELDLWWIKVGGKNPIDYFEKYPKRFMLWHIKDKAELGASGTMNYTPVFEQKKQSGFKYGIVEVEEYNFDPIVSVEKSLEYLKTTNF